MLSTETPTEFFATIEEILKSVQHLSPLKDNKTDWPNEQNRVLLKQATLTFVGNLCVEPKLRAHVALDVGGIQSRVFSMLEQDSN